MHGRTELPCLAGIVQVPTYVLLLTHPTCGGRGVCLWSVLNCGPTCVCKGSIMRVPFGERHARPTDRLGCDAHATGVLYTPYMCTAVFLRLCSMAQSMDAKLV